MKRLLQGVSVMLALPLIAAYQVLSRVADANACLAGLSQLLSLVPGKSGSYLRTACYRFTMTHCSQDAVVGFGTLFSQSDTEIHSGVYIGPQCNIGSARLDRDCLLGSGVHVLSGKQQHTITSMEIPIREQGGQFVKVTIGENSWIGNGSIVMADVGRHCVIGAGSVVIEAIPDGSVAVGNPARVIRQRSA